MLGIARETRCRQRQYLHTAHVNDRNARWSQDGHQEDDQFQLDMTIQSSVTRTEVSWAINVAEQINLSNGGSWGHQTEVVPTA